MRFAVLQHIVNYLLITLIMCMKSYLITVRVVIVLVQLTPPSAEERRWIAEFVVQNGAGSSIGASIRLLNEVH